MATLRSDQPRPLRKASLRIRRRARRTLRPLALLPTTRSSVRADADHCAGSKLVPTGAEAVDPSAVGAVEVANRRTAFGGLDAAMVLAHRAVRQRNDVVGGATDGKGLSSDSKGARPRPMAAHERKRTLLQATLAQELGAAAFERLGFDLEARHRIACADRDPFPQWASPNAPRARDAWPGHRHRPSPHEAETAGRVGPPQPRE